MSDNLSLILLPGTYWCAVAAHHDGSAILGIYGPYRTSEAAATGAARLQETGVHPWDAWNVQPLRSIDTGRPADVPCPADCGADVHDSDCAGEPAARAPLLELADSWAREAGRYQQIARDQATAGAPADRRGITGGTGATYARCAAALRAALGHGEAPS